MINMSAEDLNRTYHGTFVGIRRDGAVIPFYISNCVDANELRGQFDGDDDFVIDINNVNAVLTFPDSGVYNVGSCSSYVARRAQRQWHRGIRESELTITGDVRYGISLVRSMFNPQYRSYEETVQGIDSGELTSAALDRNWWIRKVRQAKYPLIYFRNRVVGEVDGDGNNFVSPAMKELFEEVLREDS